MTHENADKAKALENYLVAAARTGDRSALAQLAKLTGPRLLAHATRLMGDAEAARDIVQTAWIDILAGLPQLREVAAFRAFALKIVTRKVAASIKGLQHDRKLASAYVAQIDDPTPPLGDAMADQHSVRQAIDTLPAAHRVTLALFYLDELSVPEIAEVLHIPNGTVKTRLMHARAKLRAHIIGETNDKT